MNARRYESYNEDQLNQQEFEHESPLYIDYAADSENGPDIKELLFFANIAVFCILTAFFSFVFLSLKWNTFFALILAISSSLAVLKLQQLFFNKKK